MMRDGQAHDPRQAKMMARVFVIATLIGGAVVFLNVTMRSYSLRMQQAEQKRQEAAGAPATHPTPAPAAPVPAPAQPQNP